MNTGSKTYNLYLKHESQESFKSAGTESKCVSDHSQDKLKFFNIRKYIVIFVWKFSNFWIYMWLSSELELIALSVIKKKAA